MTDCNFICNVDAVDVLHVNYVVLMRSSPNFDACKRKV